MAEIKSSGSASVSVPSDSVADVFGPWTALFMGVDQATHPIVFDSQWAHLVIGVESITVSQSAGIRMDVEIGVGPISPPAETVFGPMKYTSHHTGGGKGMHTNYSFPLVLSAGDQLWCRVRNATPSSGVQNLEVFLTVSDQFKPVRPATVHFSTRKIFAPATPNGVLFPSSDLLGLWYIMGNDGSGGGMPLSFDTSWISMNVELFGSITQNARWQLGSSRDGNPPDLPELIDIGYQSFFFGSGQNSEVGDVHNFPVSWEKGDTIWVRGAAKGGSSRTFNMAATFWGNP